MSPKSNDFKKLKNTWYNKLRRSGFTDAEDDYERLLVYHSSKYSIKDPLAFSSQQRYYELAAQLLYTYSFKGAEERTMWRLHSQGKTIAHIAKKVEKSQHYVHNFISEVAKSMIL